MSNINIFTQIYKNYLPILLFGWFIKEPGNKKGVLKKRPFLSIKSEYLPVFHCLYERLPYLEESIYKPARVMFFREQS